MLIQSSLRITSVLTALSLAFPDVLAAQQITSIAQNAPPPAPQPTLIDAENASIDPDNGYLTDNGRTFIFTSTLSSTGLSPFGRLGQGSVYYETRGVSLLSWNGKQRAEHRIGGSQALGYQYEHLHDGFTKYVAFSIMLDPVRWTPPNPSYSWFIIHQLKQSPCCDPLMHLGFVRDGGNKLLLTYFEGPDLASSIRHEAELISLQTGVWYDVVIGWRFNLTQPTGFCHAWIKQANETIYQEFGWDDIVFGYTGGERELESYQIGAYRKNTTPATNRIYFDEVAEGVREQVR